MSLPILFDRFRVTCVFQNHIPPTEGLISVYWCINSIKLGHEIIQYNPNDTSTNI